MELEIFTPQQINNFLRLLVTLLIYMLATSSGAFARGMISENLSGKEFTGLTITSGVVAFSIDLFRQNPASVGFSFILCFASGFFLPTFKSWLTSKKPFLIILKIIRKANKMGETAIEEIESELEKEKDEE